MFLGVLLTSWAVMFSKNLLIRVALPLSMLVLYIGYAFVSFRSNMQVEMVPFIFSTVSTGFISFAYLNFTEGQRSEKCHISLPSMYPKMCSMRC